MKKIIISLLFVFFIQVTSAHAVLYVWTKKDTDEVLFIEKTDSVIISGEDQDSIEKTILQKDIEFYDLTETYTDYKLKDKKFILNTKKISDRENKNDENKDKEDKKDSDFETAKEKLIELGLTPEEVDSLR